MPHFCCQSKVRVDSDHCTLIINLRHRLLSGTKSGPGRTIKSKFPANVDVLLASDLILTLSGVVDRVKVFTSVLTTGFPLTPVKGSPQRRLKLFCSSPSPQLS